MGLKHHSRTLATLPTLADAARWKMDKDTDLAWLDQVHTIMGVLRAMGVLPVTRCSVNGHLHSLFSAVSTLYISRQADILRKESPSRSSCSL